MLHERETGEQAGDSKSRRSPERRPTETGNKSGALSSCLAEANCAGITGHTSVASVDNIIGRGKRKTGSCAQCSVIVAGCVACARACPADKKSKRSTCGDDLVDVSVGDVADVEFAAGVFA